MTRNTTIVCVAGVLGLIMGIVVLKQHSMIGSLRRELQTVRTASSVEALATPQSLGEVALYALDEASAKVRSAEATVTQSNSTASPSALDTLPNERESLQAQLQQVETELERTKRLIPEPADLAAAYIGAGIWANANAQSRGIRKVEIAGRVGPVQRNQIPATIKAWGPCSPVDCEGPEVAFFLLDSFDSPGSYKRGFAAWGDENGGRIYLLITFEKSGLLMDEIEFRPGRLVTPHVHVERMTRIN